MKVKGLDLVKHIANKRFLCCSRNGLPSIVAVFPRLNREPATKIHEKREFWKVGWICFALLGRAHKSKRE
jgi:hypothetical protein